MVVELKIELPERVLSEKALNRAHVDQRSAGLSYNFSIAGERYLLSAKRTLPEGPLRQMLNLFVRFLPTRFS